MFALKPYPCLGCSKSQACGLLLLNVYRNDKYPSLPDSGTGRLLKFELSSDINSPSLNVVLKSAIL